MLETDDLLVEPRDGGALWLTFNRPAAREAYDAGPVSHVTPDADFPALVDKIVRRLTQGAPLAQAATKKAVNAATLDQLEAALERERTGQTIVLRTEDVAEGMRAFNEQRRPDFRGS